MNRATLLLNATVFAGFFGSSLAALADGDVNVYTYRQPELLQPAIDAFTRKTGITVNMLHLDKGLIERMRIEGENSPADVIFTFDVTRLDELKQAGVTQTLADTSVETAIPSKFRDLQGHWFGLGMDARVFYVSKGRVDQNAITYEELSKPKWKGRICLRDGKYSANLGLFADMIAAHGADLAETWLTGIKDNLARRPSGSDVSQVQSIIDGECDIALGNSTIIAAMLAKSGEPKALTDAIRVVLPNAEDSGGFANISGMAMARYAPNRDNAVKLMEFMASPEAQQLYADPLLEYPIHADLEPAPILRSFGTWKADEVSLSDVLKYRQQASELVDKVGFNDGPAH